MKGWKANFALVVVLATGPACATPLWSAHEIKVLRSLWIGTLPPVPVNLSNRFAADPAAAALGRSLFSDTRLSANNQVSCASCHNPSRGFTDAVPTGKGIGIGNRRTMPVAQAVYSPWQFWDGRADSLWSQALGPVENPLEHGLTRTEVARVLATHYRGPYELVFGPLPELSDLRRFPARASPISDGPAKRAWAQMALADRDSVDRIFSNFGKSIEAFERTLKLGPTRFDGFVTGVVGGRGPRATLSSSEIAGLLLFTGKARCVTCHSGPMFSHEGFANTGVPARPGLPADTGRLAGARKVLADPFNCKGVYSDAGSRTCDELEFMVIDDPSQVRAFKVPSLRGVGQRAPYMHAGQLASLAQVIDHYNRAPKAPSGTSELKPLHLSARERRDLLAFLLTLG